MWEKLDFSTWNCCSFVQKAHKCNYLTKETINFTWNTCFWWFFPQNLDVMLPCCLLTNFWLFLTNLPLNLEDTTWEDWNYWGVTRLTFTNGRIERTSNQDLWSIKANLRPKEQVFTAYKWYARSFPIEITWKKSSKVATAVKPVSPQGLKLLELFLKVSSEGPFTAPTGNLNPSF